MKLHVWFSVLILLLVLAATTTGIFYRTEGIPFAFTTARGEQAIIQGSGLYRYDPAPLVREGKIWDWVNLVVGLPLLALAIFLSRRGSLRGRLLLAGLLFYFFYVYLQLMTMYAFNFMFLVYVAIFALSAVTFFINLAGIDVTGLPDRISPRFPRRLFVGFTFVLSAVLLFLWLGRIVPLMAGNQFPPELAGLTTLETQGFDLGMIVPLMLSAGILLWRSSPWGYLLTGVSLSYGALMCITLPAWIVVPLIQDGKINLVEAVPFAIISLVGLTLAMLFFKNVRQTGPGQGNDRRSTVMLSQAKRR